MCHDSKKNVCMEPLCLKGVDSVGIMLELYSDA